VLPGLAANWGLLLFRGSIAVVFGVLALLWPALTPAGLARLFAAYVLIDGGAALIVAFGVRGHPGFASLLVEALADVGAGVMALAYPGGAETALVTLVAAWAVLRGVAELGAARGLREELTGEWPLPTAGVLSIAAGLLLAVRLGAGVPTALWLIGGYVILFGLAMAALSVRMRQLALEVAAYRAARAAEPEIHVDR
jgi:uncharacterized membrane protein HdeD (DUF308 family)